MKNSCHIVLNKYPWTKVEEKEQRALVTGFFDYDNQHYKQEAACRLLLQEANQDSINNFLLKLTGHFSFILETQEYAILAVDRIRGYPLYYSQLENTFYIACGPHSILPQPKKEDFCSLSILEFAMAGYTTGADSIFTKVKQVEAGEYISWDKTLKKIKKKRYYRYTPQEPTSYSKKELLQELNDITQKIFSKLITQAAGRPIWIPLSGGLDSRFILCKLVELGYDNLQTFSYGIKNNFEAQTAKRVAKALKVPWWHYYSSKKKETKIFHSKVYKDFWPFAEELVAPQDLAPLLYFREKGILSDNAIFVNGQSGDFITGNHIRPEILSGANSWDTIVKAIVNKNYSLWENLKTPENLEKISNKIYSLLDKESHSKLTIELMASLYETWEWQERQCKFVVNAQRVYDYLNYEWVLPLWHDWYMYFFSKVPFALRKHQALYKEYLNNYNYCGVFRDFKISPMYREFIITAIARIVQMLMGMETRKKFIKRSYFFSYNNYRYASYGWKNFSQNIDNARNAVAFWTTTYQEHMNIPPLYKV